MSEAASPPRLTVVVDDREPRPGIADELSALWPSVAVGRLPVGDVEIGPRVLVERKTVADLVASFGSGRLFDQAYALRGACRRPLLVVEGDEPWAAGRLDPETLQHLLVTLLVGYGIPLLRTSSLAETARILAVIAAREERRMAGRREPEPAPPARVAMDMLGAIPGVGDVRARRLVERFGSAGAVLSAGERDLRDVPGIGRGTARAIRDAGDGAGRVSESAA
jgi:ERCC4-type nuclease